MDYKDIQDAVLRRRFDEASRSSAMQWIQDRYGKVWNYADWSIKDSVQLTLTVTAGSATVPLPSGFTWPTEAIDLYDNWGNKLPFLNPSRFFELFGAAASSPPPSSDPQAWTLTTDPSATGALTFRLGPTPISSQTFSVQGWNLPIKRTAASTWAIGSMSADSDLPWWPDDYHFFLVPGAQALGLKLENDPTWEPLEAEFNAGLQALAQQQGLSQRQPFEQWGGFWNPYPTGSG